MSQRERERQARPVNSVEACDWKVEIHSCTFISHFTPGTEKLVGSRFFSVGVGRFWVGLQVTVWLLPAKGVAAAAAQGLGRGWWWWWCGVGRGGGVTLWRLSSCRRVYGLVSRPVTLGKSWNLITASQTLSSTDLLTLIASRHALPPSKCPCTGWPLLSSLATFFQRGR